MGLILITPPEFYPVTVEQICDHLRVETDESGTISAYIQAATNYVEQATGLQLITATYKLTLDRFPQDRVIRLPKPPLISVTSIVYGDPDGWQTTLPSEAYTVDSTTKPGRIVLNAGQTWPQTANVANAVTINFTAGYGDAAAVPPLLKQCVKFLVGHYYENREGAIDRTISEVPMAVASIIDMYKFIEVV